MRGAVRALFGVGLATLVGALLWAGDALAGGGGGDDSGHAVIGNIALCLVGAAVAAYVTKILRQPLILGYLLAGVAIGPLGMGFITDHSEIVSLAEIGLILLLFMIGLEIDLKQMKAAGKRVLVPGVLQFPLCAAAAYGLFGLLESWGLDFGTGSYSRLYVSIAVSLSSTMIVVKLLFDKMELDTLPGRITVGILVFQDIWAIIVLAIQPNMNNPEVMGLLRTFGSGALLVGLSLMLSRYVLPPIFKVAARVPELILVLSLGWCFLVALVAAHPLVGLSMEMGALIAGVALATFPYNIDVVAKAISIRDFFLTLFFVALGMQIPLPTPDVLVVALAVAAVAIGVRFLGVFGVLYAMKSGHRVSLLPTINLAQVSEFSLVILSLGIGFGHIESDTLTSLIWVFSVLAVASTYLVAYSHPIQAFLGRVIGALGLRDIDSKEVETKAGHQYPIVLLGFFRIASAFFEEIRKRQPELVKQIKVVDFNPHVKEKLEQLGVAYVYGDISHPDSLHHANIHEAQFVLSTIPDSFLKGTSNRKLMSVVREMCPHGKIIVTAETAAQSRELYAEGADYVLESTYVAGEELASVVEMGMGGELQRLKSSAEEVLQDRQDVLA